MQANFLNSYSYQSTNSDIFATLPSGYSTYTALLNLFGWGGKSCWFCLYCLLYNILAFKVLALIGSGIAAVAQRGGRKFIRNTAVDYS